MDAIMTPTGPSISDELLIRARKLHGECVVIDTHVDTTQRMLDPAWRFDERHEFGHVDLPRLGEAGIDAAFFAVWAKGPIEPEQAVDAARQQLRALHETAGRFSNRIVLARTADEVRAAKRQGKFAMLIGIEGGYLIGDSLERLREYHANGAGYMTLTHSFHTSWADSSGVHEDLAPLHGGLTAFGRQVVREMNRLGMIIDVSHAADSTFWQVIETTTAPVMATHSSCRAVCPHRRNLTDEMMKAIASTGGTVQINFAAAFLDPAYPAPDAKAIYDFLARGGQFPRNPFTTHATSFHRLVDHFDHALQTVGPDHVGIGSDFDGIPAVPEGMEDCGRLPDLTAALLERGYNYEHLRKVLGGNVLRVMQACEMSAR